MFLRWIRPAVVRLRHRPFCTTHADGLVTVGDMLRYAVTRFGDARNLTYGQGSTGAFSDAALLLAYTLHLGVRDGDILTTWGNCRLTASERQRLVMLINERCATGTPMAYLVNGCYLQGEPFYVNKHVLSPRSFLGDILASHAAGRDDDRDVLFHPHKVASVWDLCTGSGCLAVLAAKLLPRVSEVIATDVSEEALDVARANVATHGVASLVRVLPRGDLFAAAPAQRCDLIVCNPPYVDEAAMQALPPAYRAEPALALHGGRDGMHVVSRVLRGAATHLKPGGGLLMEVGRLKPTIEKQHRAFAREVRWLATELSIDECFYASKAVLTRHFGAAPQGSPAGTGSS